MMLTLLICVLTCLLLGGGYQCVNIFPEKIKVTVSQIDLDPTTSVQGVCIQSELSFMYCYVKGETEYFLLIVTW